MAKQESTISIEDAEVIRVVDERTQNSVAVRLDQVASYEMIDNGRVLQINLAHSPLHHLVKDNRARPLREALDTYFDARTALIEVPIPVSVGHAASKKE